VQKSSFVATERNKALASRLEDRLAKEYREMLADMSKNIQADLSSGKIKQSDIPAIEAYYKQRFDKSALDRRQKLYNAALEEEARGKFSSRVNQAFEAIKGAGDTLTLGASSAIGARGGALARGVPLEDVQIEQEAKSAQYPGARTIGSFAGAFTGPPAMIGRTASQLTGRAFLKPTLAAAEMALERPFSGTVSKIALEGLRGATAGATANAGISAIEGLLAGKDVQQIGHDLWWGTVVGGALGGIGGGVAGSFRTPEIDQAGVELADRMKRVVPNFRTDPAFIRQSSFIQAALKWASNAPVGKSMVRRFYRRAYIDPTRKAISDLRREIAGGEVDLDKAASGVRAAVGTAGQESGALQRQINTIQDTAFFAEGARPISTELQAKVLDGLSKMDQIRAMELGSRGERSAKLSSLFRELRELADTARSTGLRMRRGEKGPEITVQVYENFKKRAREIAQFNAQARGTIGEAFSSADVREARRIYALLSMAERQTSPMVDRAMKASAPLRALQNELRPLINPATIADNATLLQQVFTGKNPLRRIAVLHRVMPPEQSQALAGAYLSDFLESVSKRAGGFNGPQANQLWRASSGKYRAEMFDAVIGSGDVEAGRRVRAILGDIFDSMDRASRTIGGAEGSPTAAYLMSANIAGDAVRSIEILNDVFSDPRIAMSKLRQAGGLVFAFVALSKTLDGSLARQLDRLATGQPAEAMTRIPIAIEEARKSRR
jgi:hypothetical protein